MFCVERSDGQETWIKEQCFKTEFKAFINARIQSLSTYGLYRVTYQSTGDSGEVLRLSNGKAVLTDDDHLVG
jgi:hypothetical protein